MQRSSDINNLVQLKNITFNKVWSCRRANSFALQLLVEAIN